MNLSPIKTVDTKKINSLSNDWTSLIQQLKNQSHIKSNNNRVDLPPILSQRKSPL